MGASESSPLVIWAVSDGRAGIENQTLGVAEAVARLRPSQIVVKRIAWKPWLRRLPTPLALLPQALLAEGSDPIAPPWPDLWIGNGRASIPFSIAMRRWSAGRTFVVQLQDPLRATRLFDLVAPPAHDLLTGANVFPMLGSAHRITPEKLAEGLAQFPELEALPRPRIAVLVGGRSKAFDLPPGRATALADELAELLQTTGGSLLMTFSRRTPEAARALLSDRLKGFPGLIWDGAAADPGPNPYLAILAAADHVLVTADSINMVAEAASTGKPVHILPLPGSQARKDRFHAALVDRGAARAFAGRLDEWTYEPLAETLRLANHLIRLLDLKRRQSVAG